MSKPHGIRIPGALLDALKGNDYENDERFVTKKRKKGSAVGRKEKRKQQRLVKKHKQQGSDYTSKKSKEYSKPSSKVKVTTTTKNLKPETKKTSIDEFSSKKETTLDDEDQSDELENDDESINSFDESVDDGFGEMTVEETLEALRRAKSTKAPTSDGLKANPEQKISSDDSEFDDSISDESDTQEMTAEETMSALKAMKEKKKTQTSKDQSKNKSKSLVSNPAAKKTKKSIMTPSERAQLERDNMDMKYYAKKLGLKSKTKKLKAVDEFDAIGGLLDGLDFFENYGEESEGQGESDEGYSGTRLDEDDEDIQQEVSEQDLSGTDGSISDESGGGKPIDKPFSSDDELSAGDFDEFDEGDLDEEELQQLRELEGEDSDSAESSGGKRENPYVAPSADTTEYVPPSLRRKQLSNDELENMGELKRKIKSSLNKLSESNISVIVTALNEVYESYPRQYVTDSFNNQIIEIIAQKNKLLDGFVLSYAAVAVSLWKLRGIEIGASFIQFLVQTFLELYEAQLSILKQSQDNSHRDEPIIISKSCNNLMTLLAYCYNFGLVSCKLIYDMIAIFIQNPNEFTTELLLRIVSVSGPLIRGDDPKALKEILSDLLKSTKSVNLTPRMKFLLETMSDLKNNRLKPSVMATNHSNMKKIISGFLKNSVSSAQDPLQVSLEDIRNIETKGKWWLVGASWKGNLETAFDDKTQSIKDDDNKTSSKIVVEDNLLDDIPDWTMIAKQQRMNTDVRRAIFVCIMAAHDYMDAFTRVEKLNLKNKQSLEIPKVLIHCLSMEGKSNGYNPYYGILAAKLCQQSHNLLKSFQFIFWDISKKFENDYNTDSDEETIESSEFLNENARLRKITNQGRFFGYLISEGVFSLEVFKHVPIMGGLSSDGMLFLEILLFQILLSVAKKSETKMKKGSKKVYTYKDDVLIGILSNGFKSEHKPVILRAFKWFATKRFKYEKYVTAELKTKEYEREKRRLQWAVPRFIQLIDKILVGVSS